MSLNLKTVCKFTDCPSILLIYGQSLNLQTVLQFYFFRDLSNPSSPTMFKSNGTGSRKRNGVVLGYQREVVCFSEFNFADPFCRCSFLVSLQMFKNYYATNTKPRVQNLYGRHWYEAATDTRSQLVSSQQTLSYLNIFATDVIYVLILGISVFFDTTDLQ